MIEEKVLLLHGPMQSRGVNPISQQLYRDAQGREKARSTFDCGPNVIALATAFRACGFKVVYSGWSEDSGWLNASSDLFDHLVLTDQSTLRSESPFHGTLVSNNKEKLYYGALRGLDLIREKVGDQAIVFRLRSDMAVTPQAVSSEISRIKRHSRQILIEYLDTAKTLWAPDFMLMAEVTVMQAIYRHLYDLSAADKSYHISSHVDHIFAYLRLREEGVISDIFCMSRVIFESLVWRGIPRYLEHSFPGFAHTFFFDGKVEVPQEFNLESVLARMRRS